MAMLLLSFHSGLRSRELCGLKVDDLLWQQKKVRISNGKGMNGDIVYGPFTDENTRAALSMWLEVFRPQVANGISGDALFLGVGGKKRGLPITHDGWRSICAKWGRRAGVDHFSPHSLRRAFAFHYAVVLGFPSEVVRKAGRWITLSSFERYLVGANLDTFLDFAGRANGHGPS